MTTETMWVPRERGSQRGREVSLQHTVCGGQTSWVRKTDADLEDRITALVYIHVCKEKKQ